MISLSSLVAVEQPNHLLAGLNPDLTGVVAQASLLPASEITLEAIDYTWPVGVSWPRGLSMRGVGATVSEEATNGSRIFSTGRIAQTIGPHSAMIIQNIQFMNGFWVKKQHTVFLNCVTDGEGMLMGGDNTAPYDVKCINHIFKAAEGKTALTLNQGSNAIQVDGDIWVPKNGRGVVTNGAEGVRLNLAFNYTMGGNPMDGNVGSLLYIDNSAHVDVNIFYFEARNPAQFTDGAHVVFTPTAFANSVRIAGSTFGLRVRNVPGAGGQNYVCTNSEDAAYRNGAAFDWIYQFPNKIAGGVNVVDVYVPPTQIRKGSLSIIPITNITLRGGCFATGAVVGSPGSGGTDGEYYQTYTDSNIVADQGPTFKIKVTNGVAEGVEVIYPGWARTLPSSPQILALNPALVGGLSGGTINVTWDTTSIYPGSGGTLSVPAGKHALLYNSDQGGFWVGSVSG